MAYVDGIVITGNSSKDIDSVVQQLHNNQIKYITEILHKTGITAASTTPTPMVSTPKLVTSDGNPPLADGHLYRGIVGMLQYMCITCPDLSFCVNKLSQYMNSPSDTHWKAVKRVLRYLIGTTGHGLCLSKGQFELVCYSDVDWASSFEDRRFTISYVVFLRLYFIAWCSKKQAVVSRSSSEAEYHSLANCVSELLWVKYLLDKIGMPLCQSPVVWCDNTSTASMVANPLHHARVKHIEIDHYFVRKRVLNGTLQANFVPSKKQVADVFTKPITPKQFASFRHALQVLLSYDDLFFLF
ncbi:hypothetical protein PVK06_004250 [Gossypium arboreum]|uniref:Retrovirus-related Pol polyprotein from transposon TNT 1-94 n=1 Tax=Gossypium arboreum TaxID=29729 RepID=A0ABR0QSF7_GOSAR|nr:hypothetical protein PVK06_004250 [Gossypium arboreum]